MEHITIILKQASNKQEFTNWENTLIIKNKGLIINCEIPQADHLTRKFNTTPVESSRSAPTRNQNSQWVDKEDDGLRKYSPNIQISDVFCSKLILITRKLHTKRFLSCM